MAAGRSVPSAPLGAILAAGLLLTPMVSGSEAPRAESRPVASPASDPDYRAALERALTRYGAADKVPEASRTWLARRYRIPVSGILSDLREVACGVGHPDEPISVVFTETCRGCHTMSGAGDREMADVFGVPVERMNLLSERTRSRTDAELRAILVNGRHEMPPYGAALDDHQLSALIAFLRTLQSGCPTPAAPGAP